MDPTQALTQATSDVTNTLMADKADPSQSSFWGSPGVQGLIPSVPGLSLGGPGLGEVIVIGAAVAIGLLVFGSVLRGR